MGKKKAEELAEAIIKPSVGDNTIAFNSRNDLEELLIDHFEKKYKLYSVLNLGLPSPQGINQICFDISDTTELVFHKFVYFWFSQKDFVSPTLQASPKTITEIHPEGEITDHYKKLSDNLYKITAFEKELDTDENKEAQRLFEKRLGKPVFYTKREKANYEALDLSIGQSWIGNLVDESHTLNIKDIGRPMKNFHEFFCSSMTTLCFDGDVFFTSLKQLKALNTEVQGFDDIYSSIKSLLTDVHTYGVQFYSELSHTENSRSLLTKLNTNLSRLELELQEQDEQRQDS